MTEILARQPQGIPVGGQFAPTAHAEPAIGLNHSTPAVPVAFQGTINLREAEFQSLPELPASVGTPEVSFDYSDAGTLETHVTVDGSTVSFWGDEMTGDIANTIDNGYTPEGEDAPWSNIATYDDFEKTRTWAEAVHERIDGATYHLLADATAADETHKTIIDFATGRSEAAPGQTPEQSSAKRAAAALAICEDGQGADITMRDLLADLRHYADAKGIDIYQAMDDSLGYYQHEKADPNFKEVY